MSVFDAPLGAKEGKKGSHFAMQYLQALDQISDVSYIAWRKEGIVMKG